MRSAVKTEKSFDCLGYKKQVQEQLYEATKGMDAAQQVAFYRKQAREGSLGDVWKKWEKAKRK
jgi:hypothetical protein